MMDDQQQLRILTLNSGSSSLKFALYNLDQAETLIASGSMERVGLKAGRFRVSDASGRTSVDQPRDLPDHEAALRTLFEWLADYAPGQNLAAVGHRVVHGGPNFNRPQVITPDLVEVLHELIALAPDHLPHEIKAMQAVSRAFPQLKQIACFDTAFHRQMPRVAQLYALPRHFWHDGIQRYGFHGLSYEYILQELRKEKGAQVADGRVIIAHLGNGASMAAVWHGKSVDTTMGFTPVSGLVMGTRSGDLDPGILLYLLEEKGMRPSTLSDLVNEHAGLLGVSGTSSDMKDLLGQEAENTHAAEAVALFCYQAKKFLGSLAAVLGGLDTLVFTGGIGENAPTIRQRICQGMEFLGIYLDPARNNANAAVISSVESRVAVCVMKTNEELMIARHTGDLVRQAQAQ
jgi:acetate kinase